MIEKKSLLILLTIFLVVACGSKRGGVGGSSPDIEKSIREGKPLVRVGDEKIYEGYLNLLQRVNPGIKGQLEAPMGKKRLVDNLVEQEMLYHESIDRGIDKLPQVKEKTDLYRRVIIAQSLIDEEVDKKAKDYYDKNKEKDFERVKIAHIFFSNTPKPLPVVPGKPPSPPSEEDKKKAEKEAETKAKETYQRLKKGESWEALVQAVSDDKGSIPRGGEMGYVTRTDRRIERLEYKPLIDVAYNSKKDAYSEPIKTKEGWHIIKVIEEKKVQPYEDVSMSIRFKLRGETKNNLIGDLKKKMKVQYLDVSLAESAPAPMPLTPASPAMKPPEPKPAK